MRQPPPPRPPRASSIIVAFAQPYSADAPSPAKHALARLAEYGEDASYLQARLHLRRGEEEEAVDALRRAADRTPGRAEVHLLLARFLFERGTIAEALTAAIVNSPRALGITAEFGLAACARALGTQARWFAGRLGCASTVRKSATRNRLADGRGGGRLLVSAMTQDSASETIT